MTWKPWLGAIPDDAGTHFRVWAPKADSLSVRMAGGPTVPLRREAEGYFAGRVEGARAGARYLYRFPDGRERPDPASLLQPEGVHGPSEVVDLAAIAPRSARAGVPLQKLDLLRDPPRHVHRRGHGRGRGAVHARARRGAVHGRGSDAGRRVPGPPQLGVRRRRAVRRACGAMAARRDLRGWSTPRTPRASARSSTSSTTTSGRRGTTWASTARYFTSKHKTPWGDALDFSLAPVRRYFVENALRWVSRAGGGFDGLRLDAIHGIYDDSPKHILQEIARGGARRGRPGHRGERPERGEADRAVPSRRELGGRPAPRASTSP